MSFGRPERKMGQHGAPISDVIFEDCHVADDALLGGEPGIGLDAAMKGLDRGRLFIAACCVGLAYRLIENATDYANGRVQFGVAIARHQLIQALLADSLTEAYAARGMVENAARKAGRGEPISCEASMCKLFATEMVGRVADRAVQVHGGNGYIADYMVEQLYRDVRVLRIYEGTSQIQQVIIAKSLVARRLNGELLS
jgi:acyl-CoA dehydrogenase